MKINGNKVTIYPRRNQLWRKDSGEKGQRRWAKSAASSLMKHQGSSRVARLSSLSRSLEHAITEILVKTKIQILFFLYISEYIPLQFPVLTVLTTFQEARLALTYKRQSYWPTGTHPSPRSASVWRLVISSGSLSSTGTPTHCSHWSLMGNTAPPHWAVTRGSGWLVPGHPCSPTAIRKDSMQWEAALVIPKQESASPLTRRMTVVSVTPELVLAQEVYLMILTRVEMRQRTRQIMDRSTSKPWVTSWYSDRGHS